MTEHFLSDLCKVCSNATPKYCCPRCGSRTCSLTCYKRHKVWSSCSGKRDPAAYLKRSELSTSSGIDRDYNFLSGVERAFERANRNDEQRLAVLEADHPGGAGNKLERAWSEGSVQVVRAPKGISRQRQNHTVWDGKNGCVDWTVEWVLLDGERQIRQVLDKIRIGQAYTNINSLKNNSGPKRKRKHAQHRRDNLDDTPKSVDEVAGSSGFATSQPTPAQHKNTKHQRQAITSTSTQAALYAPATSACAGPIESSYEATPMEPISSQTPTYPSSPAPSLRPNLTGPADSSHDCIRSQTPPSAELPPNKTNAATVHYYIHAPNVLMPAHKKLLHPIASDSTLREVLRNRKVLEFPTIFVLQQPPHELPHNFLLEDAWSRECSAIAHLTTEIVSGDQDKVNEPKAA